MRDSGLCAVCAVTWQAAVYSRACKIALKNERNVRLRTDAQPSVSAPWHGGLFWICDLGFVACSSGPWAVLWSESAP
jgi:hypothetical protein